MARRLIVLLASACVVALSACQSSKPRGASASSSLPPTTASETTTTLFNGTSPPPSLSVIPTAGPPGTTVQLVARYCVGDVGSTVESWFHSSASLADPRSAALVDSVPLQAGQAGVTGTFAIPLGTATGQGLFVVTCNSGNLTAPFGVTSGPASNQSSFATQTLPNNELVVYPTTGPVGTHVVIRGRGCNNPGQHTVDLSFDGATSKVALPELAEDSAGYFSYTYTIPAQAYKLSGPGSGGEA